MYKNQENNLQLQINQATNELLSNILVFQFQYINENPEFKNTQTKTQENVEFLKKHLDSLKDISVKQTIEIALKDWENLQGLINSSHGIPDIIMLKDELIYYYPHYPTDARFKELELLFRVFQACILSDDITINKKIQCANRINEQIKYLKTVFTLESLSHQLSYACYKKLSNVTEQTYFEDLQKARESYNLTNELYAEAKALIEVLNFETQVMNQLNECSIGILKPVNGDLHVFEKSFYRAKKQYLILQSMLLNGNVTEEVLNTSLKIMDVLKCENICFDSISYFLKNKEQYLAFRKDVNLLIVYFDVYVICPSNVILNCPYTFIETKTPRGDFEKLSNNINEFESSIHNLKNINPKFLQKLEEKRSKYFLDLIRFEKALDLLIDSYLLEALYFEKVKDFEMAFKKQSLAIATKEIPPYIEPLKQKLEKLQTLVQELAEFAPKKPTEHFVFSQLIFRHCIWEIKKPCSCVYEPLYITEDSNQVSPFSKMN